MRQYSIDELGPAKVREVREYLDSHCEKSGLENIYWLRIPDDMLSPDQYSHKQCQPHCAGIEVGERQVVFEMLVRSRNSLKCSCISYATAQQRQFILAFADRMCQELGL